MNWKEWGIEKTADILIDTVIGKIKGNKKSADKHAGNPIRDVIENPGDSNSIVVKSKRQDFNTKSILFVMPGEEAVFINDGKIAGTLPSGRHILDTSNYPFISDMISLISGNQRIHCSSLYFIRTADSQPLDWGTSLQVRDPVQLISTRLMCRGVYKIRIVNSINFIQYFIGNGWELLDQQEMMRLLQSEVLQYIKAYLSEYIMKRNEEILGISSKQDVLSAELGKIIKQKYIRYGFQIVSFSISGMDILETNRNRENIEEAYGKKRVEEIKRAGHVRTH